MIKNFFESTKFFIDQIEFRDWFDLLLVWLVVYRALLLTKKSGAVQILSGMGVLAIAYFFSIWFDLVTFNWILELVFSNLFLVVVILFQVEIRRALAQIGSNPLLFSASSIQVRHNIEEIAQGVSQLSQKGVGALVVIEREIVLDYFIESGTELDSSVSAEILNSIFASSSPLHDGAVLIRGGRIFSAGNFLPLSTNQALDKNLGTRHRAAIGLAEQTDAIVIVVSEESQTVSLVHGGYFTKGIDHATLRQELYNLLGIKMKSERSVAI
ncbi:MAG: TIGR00159 family protein [Bdellovibrionales bacterium RBG_16_40_8]|nr:MAG: TIGR00159 family protein [Bdellovibrionales bacterium RBG_16_40_8]